MSTDATLPICPQHLDRQTRRTCPRCRRPVCDLCLDPSADVQACPDCRDESRAAVTASQAGERGQPDAPAAEDAGPSGSPPGWEPGPSGSPPVREPVRSGAPLTFVLLAAYVAVFLAGEVGGNGARIVAYGAQHNGLVELGEWWRVLTATMLHGGVTHLLFNGYALYALGAQLERGVGSAAFAALYLASGLAGGIAFLLTVPDGIAVGASGAIFGLFGAWFAASWVNRDTPHGRAGLSQFGVLLLINLALPLFVPNIAWQAHMGGLVAGAVIGFDWARRGRRARAGTPPPSRVATPAVIAVALLLGLLWYTMTWS